MTDENKRKPSIPDGELENELRKLASQAEKDFGRKAGFAKVRDCVMKKGRTQIYLEEGFGNKLREREHRNGQSVDHEEYIADICYYDVNCRVNSGEFVIFELSRFPDWMRVYSQDLNYQFTINRGDREPTGGTVYSPYYGRDFPVYEGMQD
jgi:hypothetical protein